MTKKPMLAIAAVAILVGFDQWSKMLVAARLDYQVPVEVMPFIAFFRTHNDGVAFSMLSGFGVAGLIFTSLAVLLLVLWIWWRVEKGHLLAHAGFALISAGAIGNLIDRTTYGYVIDFIQFYTANWSFAIFNAADIYISLGVGAIILDEILTWRARKHADITDKQGQS